MNVVGMSRQESRTLIDQAVEVLAFLNAKTGKHYQARNPRGAPTANAELVMARLREGYTVQDLRSVTMMKFRQWSHNERMNEFLRPQTLYCRSNFEAYYGEIGPEDQ